MACTRLKGSYEFSGLILRTSLADKNYYYPYFKDGGSEIIELNFLAQSHIANWLIQGLNLGSQTLNVCLSYIL